jgi:hypothetical protein
VVVSHRERHLVEVELELSVLLRDLEQPVGRVLVLSDIVSERGGRASCPGPGPRRPSSATPSPPSSPSGGSPATVSSRASVHPQQAARTRCS